MAKQIQQTESTKEVEAGVYLLSPIMPEGSTTPVKINFTGKCINQKKGIQYFISPNFMTATEYPSDKAWGAIGSPAQEPACARELIMSVAPKHITIEAGNKVHEKLLEAFKCHPDVRVYGDTTQKANARFQLVREDQKNITTYTGIQKLIAAVNYIDQLSSAEVKNLFYYLGGKAFNKNVSEIYSILVGQNLDGIFKHNLDRIASFKKLSKEDKQYEVVITSAITNNIIEFRDGVYYLSNGVSVGTTTARIISYLKDKPEMFDLVESEVMVKMGDVISRDDMKKVKATSLEDQTLATLLGKHGE